MRRSFNNPEDGDEGSGLATWSGQWPREIPRPQPLAEPRAAG